MGATGWFHEVPWQEDVQSALDELCNSVFVAGDYLKQWVECPELLDDWRAMSEEMEVIPGLSESIVAIDNGGLPSSIDVAALLNGESGFGGILDCRQVSATPEFLCVAPLEDELRAGVFGSLKPSSEAIRLAEEKLLNLDGLDRYFGRYLIGNDHAGSPESLFFFGFSGD